MHRINFGNVKNLLKVCETAVIRNIVAFFCDFQKLWVFTNDIYLIYIRVFTVYRCKFESEA